MKRKQTNEEPGAKKKINKKARYLAQQKHIGTGVRGCFVTCVRTKERYCKEQVLSVFKNYAMEMYPELKKGEYEENDDEDDDDKVELFKDADDEIAKELASLKPNKKKDFMSIIDLDCECVFFVKFKKPIDPERFVISICEDTRDGKVPLARFAQRLTPISCTETGTLEGLKKLVSVLEPHFHSEENKSKNIKFAIKPILRNFNGLKRDQVIQTVAAMVTKDGAIDHPVDLKNYDKLVLVEAFQTTIGISVVDKYDSLHRLNLERLHEDANKKIEE